MDGTRVTTPGVSGVRITSRPGRDSAYGPGETIEVAVSFSPPVTVSGTPQLALTVGEQTRQADYASSSTIDIDHGGPVHLLFRYTTAADDSDLDGISIGADALTLNGGTISAARDSATAATLGLGTHAIDTDADHRVDGGRGDPDARGVQPGGEGDGFAAAGLVVGSARRQASYESGSGMPAPAFRYEVQAGDADPDGVGVPADALTLDGGTIRAAVGDLDAEIGLGGHALENATGHAVDGTRRADPPDGRRGRRQGREERGAGVRRVGVCVRAAGERGGSAGAGDGAGVGP